MAKLVNEVDLSAMTIDFSKLIPTGDGNSGRNEELAKLANVAKEWGMFLVRNHGIPASVFSDIGNVTDSFFALPVEEKKACYWGYMNKDNKEDGRNCAINKIPDMWIDRITVKAVPKEESEQLIWPQNPPNFGQVLEIYIEEVRKMCDTLLEDLAEALSLNRNAFLQNFKPYEESEIKIKINYYPPCPTPDQVIGLGPHSDGSALTVLSEFGSSAGFQVLKDGKWLTVSWPSDTLLMNFGDLLEIMSNGMLKSSWHRVVPPALDADRTSVALFYNPPANAEIQPIPVSYEEVYKKVMVGEYLHHHYSTRSFSDKDNKQGINFAKVY